MSAYQAMPGAFLVSAVTESHQYVFMAKISIKKDGKHKSKVKKADTTIELVENSYQILYSRILSDQTLETLYGNAYILIKQDVSIF